MEYEMEITERLRNAIVEAIEDEMMYGWSLGQLIPMLHNAIEDAVEELEKRQGGLYEKSRYNQRKRSR